MGNSVTTASRRTQTLKISRTPEQPSFEQELEVYMGQRSGPEPVGMPEELEASEKRKK
jgi:hypothetical protein